MLYIRVCTYHVYDGATYQYAAFLIYAFLPAMTLFCELMYTLQLLFTLSVSHFGDCRSLRSPVVIRSYGVSTATVSRGVFVSRHRASTFVITALL